MHEEDLPISQKGLRHSRANQALMRNGSIVKRYVSNHLGTPPEERYLSEAWALSVLEMAPRGFRFPRLIQADLCALQIEMTWVENDGRSLHLAALNGSKREQESLMYRAGELLSSIHNITKPAETITNTSSAEYLLDASRRVDAVEPILKAEGMDVERTRMMITAALGTSTELDADRVFSHGDFWLENILINDANQMGVVDWEFAKYGPRLIELGKSNLIMSSRYCDVNSFQQGYSRHIDAELLAAFTVSECVRYLSYFPVSEYLERRQRNPEFFENLINQLRWRSS